MKRALGFLAALLLATPFAFAFASCPYLDVSLLDNAQASAGVNAVFPITLTNTGISPQLASISASCDAPLQCSFDRPPYSTLSPTQSATFNLLAKSASTGLFQIPVSFSAGTNANCDSKTLSLSVNPQQIEQPPTVPYDFVFQPTANQAARPGENLVYSIKVRNNQNEKAFARFTTAGFFSGTTRFSASDVDLKAGESKTITVNMTIPPATPSKAYQQVFNARVTTTEGAQFYYSFPTQVFVYSEKLNLVLQNEPVNCTVAVHNQPTQVKLRVRNDGEIEGPFNIELNAGTAAFKILGVSPSLLEVKQGDTQDVTISINPAPSTVLDAYDYEFSLSYNGIPVFLKDYCFDVFAKTDFAVQTQSDYSVSKGQVKALLPFSVYNNGSVRQDFAVEASPPANLLVQPEPASFSLSPGESKTVNLAVTPGKSMALGKTKLPVVVRTSRFAKAFPLGITILPEQNAQQAGLQIGQESVRAFSGVETRFFVTVQNNLNADLHDAKLYFDGIPQEWYTTTPSGIPAKTTQGILAIVNVPSAERASAKKITARVETDEGKGVEKQITFYVEQPQSKLDFSVQGSKVVSEQGVKSLFVTVIVRNTGQTPLSGVKAVSTTGFAVATLPSALYLQPGQSAELTVKIDNPPSESIPLQLQSSDGTQSEPISVKASPAPNEVPWLWVVLAVIGVIAVVYLFFKRGQEKYE